MKSNFVKNIFVTMLGGLGLFISTIFLQAFLSSPPSRAEFSELKVSTDRQLQNIDDKLQTINKKQDLILEHLLKGR